MRILSRQAYSFAKIGFVGLGNMGMPMAANLAAKGHTVYGYDAAPNKSDECKAKNIQLRPSVLSLAKELDVFVTMLPNSDHSREVCDSAQGTT